MPLNVIVFKRSNRIYFECQWVDPLTGKKKTRSTKKTTRRDAERFAAKLEHELIHGTAHTPTNITWQEFRERYFAEFAKSLKPRTQDKIITAFNSLENVIDPKWLSAITSDVISRYAGELRSKERDLSSATIKGYLSHLRAALNWAKRSGMLARVPHFEIPKRSERSKGRPITEEELERMITQIGPAVGKDNAAAWESLMRGLWFSGLRLEEAMRLHWTDDEYLAVELTGKHPMFRIRAAAEKGGKDRLLPIAPEFAEILRSVPKRQRNGFVFKNLKVRNRRNTNRMSSHFASKTISRIGKRAKVVVLKVDGQPKKYGSAHDFRRAFGLRWAMRVLPPVLMEMMRHDSIITTMQYYIGRNADLAADSIWSAFRQIMHGSANTFADSTDSGES